MTQAEIDVILADETKRIEADLNWRPEDDSPHAVGFRVDVESDAGHPLFVRARHNRAIGTTTFSLIHKSESRICGLCAGKAHHNPTCDTIGEPHIHRWQEPTRDKVAEEFPTPTRDPVELWGLFCGEARIRYSGTLERPAPVQLEL